MYFFPRFLGNVGPTGIPGPVGPSGPKGDRGAEGQALSGVTYNRWGRTNCSGDTSVVYTGMRITSIYIYKTIENKKTWKFMPLNQYYLLRDREPNIRSVHVHLAQDPRP